MDGHIGRPGVVIQPITGLVVEIVPSSSDGANHWRPEAPDDHFGRGWRSRLWWGG